MGCICSAEQQCYLQSIDLPDRWTQKRGARDLSLFECIRDRVRRPVVTRGYLADEVRVVAPKV